MVDVGSIAAIQIWTLASVLVQIIFFILCTMTVILVSYFAVKAVSLFIPRMLDDLIEKNVEKASDSLLETYTGQIDDFLDDTLKDAMETLITSLKMSNLGKQSGAARSQRAAERELATGMIRGMGADWLLQLADGIGGKPLVNLALQNPEMLGVINQYLTQKGGPILQNMMQGQGVPVPQTEVPVVVPEPIEQEVQEKVEEVITEEKVETETE